MYMTNNQCEQAADTAPTSAATIPSEQGQNKVRERLTDTCHVPNNHCSQQKSKQ